MSNEHVSTSTASVCVYIVYVLDRGQQNGLPELRRDIYQVLSDLCCSDKAARKTLAQLLTKLNDHLNQCQIRWLNHLNYGQIKDNESITDYSLALKKLTVHAHFPDLIHWLRDMFVTGLNRNSAI